MLCGDIINVILCLWLTFSVLMVLIVLRGWIMGRITKDDRCLIETIKTEQITHKHNMT